MQGIINISTYHEYVNEGAFALRTANDLTKKRETLTEIDDEYFNLTTEINIQSRYAFLMFANSLEAAANALLIDLGFAKESYDELERINTLSKFHLFCELNYTPADKGNHLNNFVKEIINCRNEFVHPKPKTVNYDLSKSEEVYATKKTKTKGYPLYFYEIKFKHSLEALKDILSFLSWIVFDTCKFDLQEGSLIIGHNSCSVTEDISIIGIEHNIDFDLRTFGRQ